jgi:poly(A) polymerase Pap1
LASLVPHVDELNGTLKEMKEDLPHLEDMRKDLRCIKYVITRAAFFASCVGMN